MIIFKKPKNLRSEHLTRIWNLIQILIWLRLNSRMMLLWKNSLRALYRSLTSKHLRNLKFKITKYRELQRKKKIRSFSRLKNKQTPKMLKLRNQFNHCRYNSSRLKITVKLHREDRNWEISWTNVFSPIQLQLSSPTIHHSLHLSKNQQVNLLVLQQPIRNQILFNL